VKFIPLFLEASTIKRGEHKETGMYAADVACIFISKK